MTKAHIVSYCCEHMKLDKVYGRPVCPYLQKYKEECEAVYQERMNRPKGLICVDSIVMLNCPKVTTEEPSPACVVMQEIEVE